MNDLESYLPLGVASECIPLADKRRRKGLLSRLIFLALTICLEVLLIPVLLNSEGLTSRVSAWGPWILRGFEGFAVLFITFAWIKHKAVLGGISAELSRSPINSRLLTAHLASIIVCFFVSSRLIGGASSNLLVAVWLTTGVGAIAFAGSAFIPPRLWLRMLRGTGFLWIWAVGAAALASCAGSASQFLSPLITAVTFRLSQAVLGPFVSGIVVDPANLIIGTSRFTVQVGPVCSGLEGIGLILAFGIVWLALFRRECRFPRALLLLPAGVALIFALNAVRIAALVLIGNAGAEQIARRGFHSQAGWIGFNLVALGFCLAASKISWLTVAGPGHTAATSFENPATRWLLPFIMLVAAGMLSAASTGSFEWTYPLRFFAVATPLAFLWHRYTYLDWRVGWLPPVIGAAVFLVWIGFDRFTSPLPEAMPAPLAAASPLNRTLWLIIRALAATLTVPIAEELAFRGFLYRRLLSPDFESVSFRRFSWTALLVSSAIFGALHGDRWLVGTLAGALYTLALLWRGRIGDAVAAHATTNALIAVDVLAFHKWHLW